MRNYIPNLDVASPAAADGVVRDPSVRDRLEETRATTSRDLGLNPSSSVPSEHPPVGHSPIASPGRVNPAYPEGGNPSGTDGSSHSHGSSGGGTPSRSAYRGGLTSRGGRGSRGGASFHGGRGATTSQRPATRSTANLPNARTTRELQRLAFYTKGGFPDIAHKTDRVSFVEYVNALKTTQSNVPQKLRDVMKLADPDLWRVAAENEIKSLQDLNVYSLVPRSTVRPGKQVVSIKWVFRIKPKKTYKARLVAQGWNKVRDRTATAHSLQYVYYRVFEWCLLFLRKWTGRYASWTSKRLSSTLILRRACSWRSHQVSRLRARTKFLS